MWCSAKLVSSQVTFLPARRRFLVPASGQWASISLTLYREHCFSVLNFRAWGISTAHLRSMKIRQRSGKGGQRSALTSCLERESKQAHVTPDLLGPLRASWCQQLPGSAGRPFEHRDLSKLSSHQLFQNTEKNYLRALGSEEFQNVMGNSFISRLYVPASWVRTRQTNSPAHKAPLSFHVKISTLK